MLVLFIGVCGSTFICDPADQHTHIRRPHKKHLDTHKRWRQIFWAWVYLGISILIWNKSLHMQQQQAASKPYYIGHFGISSFNQTVNDTQMTVSQNLENSIDIVSGIKHL